VDPLPGDTPPILLGDLNINLCAPRDKRDEKIAKVGEDVMGMVDLFKHFCQQSCGTMHKRWTLRMRRGMMWISS
jgi:hypothetical protein